MRPLLREVMPRSRGEAPVAEQWYERNEKYGRGHHEAASRWPRGSRSRRALFRCGLVVLSRLAAQHVSQLLPDEAESDRRPHAPRRVAPDVEVVSVTDFAIHRVAKAGVLRPPVLEVQIVDECQRHREHQRAEIPESLSVSIPVDVAAKQAEAEEQKRHHELQSLHRLV